MPQSVVAIAHNNNVPLAALVYKCIRLFDEVLALLSPNAVVARFYAFPRLQMDSHNPEIELAGLKPANHRLAQVFDHTPIAKVEVVSDVELPCGIIDERDLIRVPS